MAQSVRKRSTRRCLQECGLANMICLLNTRECRSLSICTTISPVCRRILKFDYAAQTAPIEHPPRPSSPPCCQRDDLVGLSHSTQERDKTNTRSWRKSYCILWEDLDTFALIRTFAVDGKLHLVMKNFCCRL